MRVAPGVFVFDDFLQDPYDCLAEAKLREFRSYSFGDDTFHGIAPGGVDPISNALRTFGLSPSVSFFRRSPHGQVEPNFVHTDEMMGDWTAILYLNPEPPKGDGTIFWGLLEMDKPERLVEAKFNRMVLFDARLRHSRAIFENYGEGDSARLIQVTFGTGDLEAAMKLKEAA